MGGNKRAVQSGSNSAHPQFPQISLVFFFSICTLALCTTISLHPRTTNFSASICVCVCVFFPFVINLIFMGFTVLAQTAPYLPRSRGKGNSWCWFFSPCPPTPLHNSFWINSPVFRDNPNSLLFPLHRLDDIPISTYHIQGKLYTQQTFLFSLLFSCLLSHFHHAFIFSLSTFCSYASRSSFWFFLSASPCPSLYGVSH